LSRASRVWSVWFAYFLVNIRVKPVCSQETGLPGVKTGAVPVSAQYWSVVGVSVCAHNGAVCTGPRL
jgi:hypothetical protein